MERFRIFAIAVDNQDAMSCCDLCERTEAYTAPTPPTPPSHARGDNGEEPPLEITEESHTARQGNEPAPGFLIAVATLLHAIFVRVAGVSRLMVPSTRACAANC